MHRPDLTQMTKALIRLRGYEGWSAPLMFAKTGFLASKRISCNIYSLNDLRICMMLWNILWYYECARFS